MFGSSENEDRHETLLSVVVCNHRLPGVGSERRRGGMVSRALPNDWTNLRVGRIASQGL